MTTRAGQQISRLNRMIAHQSCPENIILRHQLLTCFFIAWRYPKIWLDISADFFEYFQGQIDLFPFWNRVSGDTPHANVVIPMQIFPALVPIFISLARFPGAFLPPSYAPSSSRKENTRARTRMTGTSFGSSDSTSRRSRVQRFQTVVPMRSTSSHLGASIVPNLFGKVDI